jgi:hypothetical protein
VQHRWRPENALYTRLATQATISSTLAPPKPFMGLAEGSVLVSWAVKSACPMSILTARGRVRKSRSDVPTHLTGFSASSICIPVYVYSYAGQALALRTVPQELAGRKQRASRLRQGFGGQAEGVPYRRSARRRGKSTEKKEEKGIESGTQEGKKSRAHEPCGSCALFQLCREVFEASRLNLA